MAAKAEPKKLNVYQKLVEVRKVADYLKKQAGTQYSYVGSSQVLAKVRDKMDEMELLLIPKITGKTLHQDLVTSVDKYNNEKHRITFFTELEMEMEWVNAENPEDRFTVPWYSQGVDIAGEKGVGKALTYAEKYFMLKQFNIPTDNMDPDAFQEQNASPEEKSKKQEQKQQQREQKRQEHFANEAQAKMITKGQFATIRAIVKEIVQLKGVEEADVYKSLSDHKMVGPFNQIADLTEDKASVAITVLSQWKKKAKDEATG